jgi:GTP-binding protein HflX
LGKGKLIELKKIVTQRNIDTVICDDELHPNQQLELERFLDGVKVIDRTALILDIFASNAQTKEGRLQVELAQHEYLFPRLAGQWTHLERLGGGIGTRGPGESQIETDRRLARGRIRKLKKELQKVRRHRERYRARRKSSNIPVVALVGYTNAGKSTMLNQLTASSVLSENRMFSTLDPITRKLRLLDGETILITDTVGFIQKLPTTLIAAFRATLEEANEADLILNVVDSSHLMRDQQVIAVKGILDEIGLADKPIITLLNKCDKLPENYPVPEEDNSLLSFLSSVDNPVFCSGLTGLGNKEILRAIEKQLNKKVGV